MASSLRSVVKRVLPAPVVKAIQERRHPPPVLAGMRPAKRINGQLPKHFMPLDEPEWVTAEGVETPEQLEALRADGADDAYLRSLIAAIGAGIMVSGIGERPAIMHMRDYGLAGFTSGSVCIAPRGSMKLLRLLQEKRYDQAEAIRAA